MFGSDAEHACGQIFPVSGLATAIAGCFNPVGRSHEGFISRIAENFGKARSPEAFGSGTSEKARSPGAFGSGTSEDS